MDISVPHEIATTIEDIVAELAQAEARFGPMASAHEGYAVIKEELDELWEQIRLKSGTAEGRRTEALQVATMALRFLKDISGDPNKM